MSLGSNLSPENISHMKPMMELSEDPLLAADSGIVEDAPSSEMLLATNPTTENVPEGQNADDDNI
jgi:hypothetical protein